MPDPPASSSGAAAPADTQKVPVVRPMGGTTASAGLSGAFAINAATGLPDGFTEERLRELYRALLLPRMIEEKMLLVLRQGKLSKWFSGIGQEAIAVGVATALQDDDWILPMHRNLGVFTARGVRPRHASSASSWAGTAASPRAATAPSTSASWRSAWWA